VPAHHHAAVAGVGHVLVQRKAQRPRRPAPVAGHDREIALADPSVAHRRVHRGQRRALAGDQQHPRCLAVDPVHQLEQPRLRPRRAQPLDHPEVDPAAAVHGHAGRLVDRQQRIVLEQDRELLRRGRVGRVAGGRADRRDPDQVPLRQPMLGRHATLVHPDLAAAHDPVDVALGHALELAEQEVVQPLPRMRVVDHHLPHIGPGRRCGRRGCVKFCR
jgi:hypothetical protein